jgi:hypothetical protein
MTEMPGSDLDRFREDPEEDMAEGLEIPKAPLTKGRLDRVTRERSTPNTQKALTKIQQFLLLQMLPKVKSLPGEFAISMLDLQRGIRKNPVNPKEGIIAAWRDDGREKFEQRMAASRGAYRETGAAPQAFFTGENQPTVHGDKVNVPRGAYGTEIIIIKKSQDYQETEPGPAILEETRQNVRCYDVTHDSLVLIRRRESGRNDSLDQWLHDHADDYIGKTSLYDEVGQAGHLLGTQWSKRDADEYLASIVEAYQVTVLKRTPSEAEAKLNTDTQFVLAVLNPEDHRVGANVNEAYAIVDSATTAVENEKKMRVLPDQAKFYEKYMAAQNVTAPYSLDYEGGNVNIGVEIETMTALVLSEDEYEVIDPAVEIRKEFAGRIFGMAAGGVLSAVGGGNDGVRTFADQASSLVEGSTAIKDMLTGEKAEKKLGDWVKVEFSATGGRSASWGKAGAEAKSGVLPCPVKLQRVGGSGEGGWGFRIGDVESLLVSW